MKRLLFLLILATTSGSQAQGEANNWYFGFNAGITFNTSPPSSLANGKLSTPEGCSSISDVNGNLLMYTDGRTIWNKNHQIMPNADYFAGTGLNGDPSSTSSGLIVPHPIEEHLYYVFTVDEPHHDNANAYPNQGPANRFGNPILFYTDIPEHRVPDDDDGFNNGVNYSIVDMTLNNGLGDVIQSKKNIELITYDINDPEEIKYKASEKITAVRGRDCNSVWVITHFRDKFYAFYIDDDGLDENPVISQVPPLIEITNYRRASIGYLKASPNADKLLTAHQTTTYNPQDGTQDAGDGSVYAYDFDNLTGKVSNPIRLLVNVSAYGVEFSQDGSKAYASVNDLTSRIYQWDLSSYDIPITQQLIANVSGNAALQLGPDGRIYHSLFSESKLGVIRNPDVQGIAAGYTENIAQGAIQLTNPGSFGLPPFIQSLLSKRIPIIETENDDVIENISLCDSDFYQLGYEDIPGATYTWSKNGEVLSNENKHQLEISVDPNSQFPLEDDYRLEVDLNNGECPLIGLAKVTFNESPEYKDIEIWTCKEKDQDGVYDLTDISTELSQEALVDRRDILLELYETESDLESGEGRITQLSNYINNQELSSLFAKVTTYGSCENIVEIKLNADELPDLETDDEMVVYCLEDFPNTLSLSATEENIADLEFIWSTGETSPEIEINSAGEYKVDVYTKETDCFQTKVFMVRESNMASFEHQIERYNNMSNLEIILSPSSLGEYEFAIGEPTNFQDSNSFKNLRPGIYTVFVRDKFGCGISEKTIGVLGLMEFFTPNGDGINDLWQVSGQLQNSNEDILLQVYDRYGKLLSSFTNRDEGWDGTYNGKNMPTDDYWYKIRLTDGTVETGNFTLKR